MAQRLHRLGQLELAKLQQRECIEYQLHSVLDATFPRIVLASSVGGLQTVGRRGAVHIHGR